MRLDFGLVATQNCPWFDQPFGQDRPIFGTGACWAILVVVIPKITKTIKRLTSFHIFNPLEFIDNLNMFPVQKIQLLI